MYSQASLFTKILHTQVGGSKRKTYIILSYNKVTINVHMHHLAMHCLPCTHTLGSALPVPPGVPNSKFLTTGGLPAVVPLHWSPAANKGLVKL